MPKAVRVNDVDTGHGCFAARIGDAIDCGGTLAAGSPDITIG
jgi:uncharacterized Zn-binding protein involved in type VI secretion